MEGKDISSNHYLNRRNTRARTKFLERDSIRGERKTLSSEDVEFVMKNFMTGQWAGACSKLSNESNPIQSLKVILQELKIGHNYANDPTVFVKKSIWSKKKEENKKEKTSMWLLFKHTMKLWNHLPLHWHLHLSYRNLYTYRCQCQLSVEIYSISCIEMGNSIIILTIKYNTISQHIFVWNYSIQWL